MQIHGIPVNLKLNSTVLIIASFVISVVAGLIFGFAGVGRGVYVTMYTVGMAYLKMLFLLALPLVFLNLVSGVMQRVQLQSDRSYPARLWFFHSVAVIGAAVLGLAAGGITGSSMIPATFAGFADFGLRWLRPLVPWLLFLSVLIGAAAAKIGPEGEEARRMISSLADVTAFAGTLWLRILPLGLFFLLCPMIGVRGLAVLWPGVKLVLVTAFCCVAYGVLVYGYQLHHCGRDCPMHFLRNFKSVLLQALPSVLPVPGKEMPCAVCGEWELRKKRAELPGIAENCWAKRVRCCIWELPVCWQCVMWVCRFPFIRASASFSGLCCSRWQG